ncbi:response regulator transcription factor [Microvirga lotononidis]|uniref:Response regulator containing a CheY-like receiver domain and an HTH DNA-binding domain n=1 Tax=Microvirga lotononidis TaxID=864069 RepID=I4Z2R7_9HYPH|nr:response regulator transcription factor [Microvirga lotononidis]EIM30509.1 response regulator containing a CheY-like receiver domain and an HTH DNA-binding domain [Microvirga lotononidis]WQO26345.1 response regulator transcription factor [Microvirga lotononidis]
MDTTPEPTENPGVMILDVRSLRRAGLSSLLKAWAQSCGLTLMSSDLSDYDVVENCKMFVLSIGSSTLEDPIFVQKIKALQAQQPEAVFVALSDQDDPDEILRAFQIGFRGFIPTCLEPEIVFQVLTFLIKGGSFFPPAILQRFLSHSNIMLNGSGSHKNEACADEARSAHGLTVRQQEVLELLRHGVSNKVIGRQLHMTEATVKVHVRQIMRKLGASNRTQAAVIISKDTSSVTSLGLD